METKMKMKILICCIVFFFLTGCIPNYSIEDAGMILIAGYDYVDEDKIRGTIAMPEFGRLETGGAINEKYLSTTANTVREIQSKLQREASKPLTIGKLALALYNEELARNGISQFIDNLGRNPRIGRDIYLAIVEGNAKDFVETRYSKSETTSKYVTGIIKHNMESNFPTTNLHEFLYAYYAKGMDGFLPIMKKEKNTAKISGIAFFKEGKFVHEIPFSKSFIFKIMNENFLHGTQEITYDERHIVMENIGSAVKHISLGTLDQPRFVIDIKLTGIINEVYTLDQPQSPQKVKQMEKAFEKYYTKQCNEMMKEFQEKDIDPIGLGNVMKSRVRNFKADTWRKLYPSAQVKFNITVDIVETGIAS